ncbi:MAG: hypothetical protein HXY40_16465 [Chloroflexi bacterium]|nr:hypothetical protein [Chloroflexota bacterium]
MKIRIRYALIIHFTMLAALFLGACQAIGGQNMMATLEASNNAYMAEATGFALTADVRSTEIAATVQAVSARANQINTVNQHLLATVIAGTTPTAPVAVGVADVSSVAMPGDDMSALVAPAAPGEPLAGGTTFLQIATTASVRASDGCPDFFQSEFALDSQRIYITALAVNLRAGTTISAEWSFNGSIVVTNSPWSVPQDYASICVWFYISPSDVSFSAGSWSARLLANGTPIEPAAAFSIVGQ